MTDQDAMHNKIVKAVRELAPDASWALVGFDLNGIEWSDKLIPRPSNEDIIARMMLNDQAST